MYSKSSVAYRTLRNLDILKLPSERTLKRYRGLNQTGSGWHAKTIIQMQQAAQEKGIFGYGCCGGLCFDEMKLQEGLVFDVKSNELRGFVDLSDLDKEISRLSESPVDATVAKICVTVFLAKLGF